MPLQILSLRFFYHIQDYPGYICVSYDSHEWNLYKLESTCFDVFDIDETLVYSSEDT